MNKNDEQMISRFMQAHKKEVADNGFSRRVMRRLPVSAKVWSDLLTAVCTVLGCILLYVTDGLNVIFHALREVFQSQSMELMNNNLPTLLVALATIAFLSIRSAWTIKE